MNPTLYDILTSKCTFEIKHRHNSYNVFVASNSFTLNNCEYLLFINIHEQFINLFLCSIDDKQNPIDEETAYIINDIVKLKNGKKELTPFIKNIYQNLYGV